MALKITHTCEWCNTVVECSSIKLPNNWHSKPVHDPEARTTRDGGFCSEDCIKLYKDNEPDAIASAEIHYKNEYTPT